MKKRTNKKAKPEFDYARKFDEAMSEMFNEEFETTWSIFQGPFGGYVTVRKNGKRLTQRMAFYGRGFSDGIAVMKTWSAQ